MPCRYDIPLQTWLLSSIVARTLRQPKLPPVNSYAYPTALLRGTFWAPRRPDYHTCFAMVSPLSDASSRQPLAAKTPRQPRHRPGTADRSRS